MAKTEDGPGRQGDQVHCAMYRIKSQQVFHITENR